MNTTSFQTTHYNHAHQASIHGTSNLKVLAGEDLSILHLTQLLEIVSVCNKCNLTTGGDSKWNRSKERITCRRKKKICLITRPVKSPNIANNLNSKKLSVFGIWKLPIVKLTYNSLIRNYIEIN